MAKEIDRAEAIQKAQLYFGTQHRPEFVGWKDGCWAVLFSDFGVVFGYDGEVYSEVNRSLDPKLDDFAEIQATCFNRTDD